MNLDTVTASPGSPAAIFGGCECPKAMSFGENAVLIDGRCPMHGQPAPVVFDVVTEPDGGFCAAARGFDIFAQGDAGSELVANIRGALAAYFFDQGPRGFSLSFGETTAEDVCEID